MLAVQCSPTTGYRLPAACCNSSARLSLSSLHRRRSAHRRLRARRAPDPHPDRGAHRRCTRHLRVLSTRHASVDRARPCGAWPTAVTTSCAQRRAARVCHRPGLPGGATRARESACRWPRHAGVRDDTQGTSDCRALDLRSGRTADVRLLPHRRRSVDPLDEEWTGGLAAWRGWRVHPRAPEQGDGDAASDPASLHAGIAADAAVARGGRGGTVRSRDRDLCLEGTHRRTDPVLGRRALRRHDRGEPLGAQPAELHRTNDRGASGPDLALSDGPVRRQAASGSGRCGGDARVCTRSWRISSSSRLPG